MKKMLFLALTLALVLGATPVLASGPVNYGDITLSGGSPTGHFSEWWDLTAGDMAISFTYDANGLVDDIDTNGDGWQDAHAWAELGVRSPCYGDFNPTYGIEGAGVWLATDYHWAVNTFDPDPPGSPTLDLDDKLILQKAGGHGESDYNLPSTPPSPGANHAVWFDRDGVDQWQAQMWGAIDGVTYNTGGTYDVIITLHATGDMTGEATMTINGEAQGFYVPNWHSGPPDLYPAGMTFTGDMKHLQVFYGLYGYGVTHSVVFQGITVTGHPATTPAPPCAFSIDIKPGSDPNSINLKKKGLIAVAILGSADFDVTTVDVETLAFGPDGALPAHDLADPDVYAEHLEDVNSDGFTDLVSHYRASETGIAEGDTEACLSGTTHGRSLTIAGCDSIRVK
jgi:hypothetical protein